MNCPKCGAENASSRLYCSACGTSLTKPLSEVTPQKRRSYHTKTLLGIAGVIALNLFSCGLSSYQNSLLLFFLILYAEILAAVVVLWRRGSTTVAITIGAVALTVAVLALLGNLWTRYDTKRFKDHVKQQTKDMEALAQTWGPGILACDGRRDAVPASQTTSGKIVLVEVPRISDWQTQLPPGEQASPAEQASWVVCLNPQKIDAACDYDGGVKLSYHLMRLDIRLYYVGDGQIEDLGGTQIAGTADDSCPPEVHTMYGAIDYVILADGSHAGPGTLHLDQTVSFDQAYQTISQMMADHKIPASTVAPAP